MSDALRTVKLSIWRQPGPDSPGEMVAYAVPHVSPDLSLVETLDLLNEDLIRKGEDPVAFESDCREGICGQCGVVVAGVAHGRKAACTTCEIRLRDYEPEEVITIEPFRARAFPVIKDLVVDRTAFDRVIAKGGYVSINTGSAPEANTVRVPTVTAEKAMDAAACIGCGACVASCPNASASLFVAAKVSHLATMPQGLAERHQRALSMIDQMDAEGFGDCSNHGECEAVCPKEISISVIAHMRREYVRGSVRKMLG